MHTGINKGELQNLRNWFSGYLLSFKNGEPDLLENVTLKELHTQKVCEAIIEIGKSLRLNEEELQLAEIIALFHDVGRFEQYKIYGTFMDSKSVNHAELGIEILLRHNTLDHLSAEIKNLIIKAIRYHNRPRLPELESEECLLYARLIRDADKMDIYRLLTEYYSGQKQGKRNKAIELELPDTANASETVISAVINRAIVNFKDVNNLNDFKLLQLAWIYDVNFSFTHRYISNKKYLESIWDSMIKANLNPNLFLAVSDHLASNIKLSAIDHDQGKRCRNSIKVCQDKPIFMDTFKSGFNQH